MVSDLRSSAIHDSFPPVYHCIFVIILVVKKLNFVYLRELRQHRTKQVHGSKAVQYITGYANPNMICSVIIACGIDKKVVLPSSLAVIEDEAFYGTSSIEYVVLPEGVTTIGSLAFADCANLYLVDIPASVTQIEPNAFANSNRVYILTIYDSNAYHYAVEHGIPVLTK